MCDHFTKGIKKLEEVTAQIKELNDKLLTQRVIVTERKEICQAILKDIVQNQNLAIEKEAQSSHKDKEIETQSKKIGHEKVSF